LPCSHANTVWLITVGWCGFAVAGQADQNRVTTLILMSSADTR
jgi:hypothetical protein